LDQTVERSYDVSHLSVTCEDCGEFARFINEDVFEQYRAFEESPPEHLDWERLSRTEKFFVSNGVVREGKSIEDFDTEES
jgi:RNase P subunit RPR2